MHSGTARRRCLEGRRVRDLQRELAPQLPGVDVHGGVACRCVAFWDSGSHPAAHPFGGCCVSWSDVRMRGGLVLLGLGHGRWPRPSSWLIAKEG